MGKGGALPSAFRSLRAHLKGLPGGARSGWMLITFEVDGSGAGGGGGGKGGGAKKALVDAGVAWGRALQVGCVPKP